MKTTTSKFLWVLLATMCMSLIVSAQTGGIFSITESVVAGGGGTGTGGIFSLDYTVGQAVAGNIVSGGQYDVTPGFWPDSSPAATSTPTPSVAISGTITYGNAVSGPPPPRFVSHVLISGAGSPAVSVFSDFPGGNYSLTGFGSGAYAVTPSKTGGVNGISSFDAGKVAQHVAGVNTLTGNQLVVADVSGNGAISSFDAGQIARYVTSSPPFGSAGTWRFTPANRNYASVISNIAGDDYTALLMGEVSGNWTNTGARADSSSSGDRSVRSINVTLPHQVTLADSEVSIPVSVQGAADKGIIAYEFVLRYDPSVIQPQASPLTLAGTVSEKLTAVANAEEKGILRVAIYGAEPISENGILLNLNFNTIGVSGSVSPLILERIMFNEGETFTKATNGRIDLSAAKWN